MVTPCQAPQTIDGSGNTPDAGIGYPGGDGNFKTFLTLVVVQVVMVVAVVCGI